MDSSVRLSVPVIVRAILIAWVLGQGTMPIQAHPLGGTPPQNPVVPGFDRIAGAKPSDEQLTRGGVLLLTELHCTACHAAPEAWREELPAKAAPSLAGVGSRLDAEALVRLIRDPQQHKGGTLMPGLFSSDAGAVASVDTLAAYLSSLKETTTPLPEGDLARGMQLYHSVGCVACHEPDAAARPEQPLPKLQNASVPLALAGDYNPRALAHFLLDPLRHRPSGRMPSMRLNAQEAADIAKYLHRGRHAEDGKANPISKLEPDAVARGREQFSQSRCSSCHSTGEELPKTVSPPLVEVAAERGCLAPGKARGIPRYGLSDGQRRALQLALQRIRSGPPTAPTAAQKIDDQFTRLNCLACHVRNGQGGPEPARAVWFTTNDPGAESLGEFAHVPPNLNYVGRKLTHEWFAKILWGEGGSVRPYMNTRMPNFGQPHTEPLIAWLEEADQSAKPVQIDVSGLLGHQRAEPGRKLLGITGLGCVSCHGLKDRKSPGPPVVRLTQTVARLRPEYFKELLLDPQGTQTGTLMPPLFTGRKGADKEIESIWTYLREVEGQPLPEGLFSDADYELMPAKAGRPIILRSFIEGSGSHAIGVGFPQGLNASFDAKTCRWTLVWKGRFLDALSNWQDRSMKPIKPLGTEVKVLPSDGASREFRGYRLEKDGVPVMLYAEGDVAVEDRLVPDAEGKAFSHVVKRGAAETREVLSW